MSARHHRPVADVATHHNGVSSNPFTLDNAHVLHRADTLRDILCAYFGRSREHAATRRPTAAVPEERDLLIYLLQEEIGLSREDIARYLAVPPHVVALALEAVRAHLANGTWHVRAGLEDIRAMFERRERRERQRQIKTLDPVGWTRCRRLDAIDRRRDILMPGWREERRRANAAAMDAPASPRQHDASETGNAPFIDHTIMP